MLNEFVESTIATPLLLPIAIIGVIIFFQIAYHFAFHPLRHVPGPIWFRLTPIPLLYHAYIGTEASRIDALHTKYGPVVRIGPSALSVSSADALHPIYVQGGGLRKPGFYRNFDIDGHATIFSTLDHEYRAKRAKPVVGLFAMSRVRDAFAEQHGSLRNTVDDFVARLRARKTMSERWDVLSECRRLAVDVVTVYLYGRQFGALTEDGILSSPPVRAETTTGKTGCKTSPSTRGDTMSASLFVDFFVAAGRFLLLPTWLFQYVDAFVTNFYPNHAVEQSMECVEAYAESLVRDAKEEEDTYQARLLRAGISTSEVKAQCKDLIFAGTDSTAQTITTIIFHLLRNADILSELRHEVLAQPQHQAALEPSPMLNAVVKEGLRLSMANPPRLARQVGPEGMRLMQYDIPAGTTVGCASYTLHLDKNVYPEPLAFQPRRWLESESKSGVPVEVANRNWMAFGAGPRQCIARTLATQELLFAVEALAASDVLDGLRTVQDKIEVIEWFNSKVKGGKVEVEAVRSIVPATGG